MTVATARDALVEQTSVGRVPREPFLARVHRTRFVPVRFANLDPIGNLSVVAFDRRLQPNGGQVNPGGND